MRLWLLVGLLGLGAGCEWILGDEGPRFDEETTLTTPWSDLGLPIAGAKVTYSDADTVSVHHADVDTMALGARYAEALKTAGWTKDDDTSAGGIVNQTWSKGDVTVVLSVQDDGEVRIASLSVLPF